MDSEERIVFNYLEEEFIENHTGGQDDSSFDENQNSKSSKDAKSTTNKNLLPFKIDSNLKASKKRKINSPGSTKIIPSKVEDTRINGITLPKGRSPRTKKNSKSPVSKDNIEGPIVKSIKTENLDDGYSEDFMPSGFESIAIKEEPCDDTNCKVKCELPAEEIKNMRATKNDLNIIESLGKVINLNPKCKPSKNLYKCNKCLYVGNSKANLERHTLIHMDPAEILWYKCTECDYKSKYETQLKGHMLVHKNPDEIKYYQCAHCALKCSRKHNLNNHIRTKHSDRMNTFQCADCFYTTFSKDRLAAHVKIHTNELYMCHMCKFVTKHANYLASHFKQKHTLTDKPFPCDTCSYKGKTKRELDRHYSRMHNKEQLKTYQCIHCNFSSIYKKNLEFHLLHMHQNSEGFQKFICGHCQKEFAYKNGLKVHIVRMHLKLADEDWQRCQECKYKTKDVSTLKRHIKRNHGAPRLHCELCDFATNRGISMDAHVRSHKKNSDEIIKCPTCPYRITNITSFVYHMRVIHDTRIGTKDIHKYYLKKD